MWGSCIWCSVIAYKVLYGTLFVILIAGNFWANLQIFPLDIKEEYEYIIVGTGVGGSTVAAGIKSADVLILEAGTAAFTMMSIPGLGPLLQNSPYEWNFHTEPQESGAKALKNRQVHLPLGRTLGGSHMLNLMMYIRGHPDDYRDFVEQDYDFQRDIEEHFEQFERDLKPHELKFHTKLADAFIEAGQESGLVNFTLPQVTQRHGMRFTMAKFHQELENPGHRVILGALVTRVTLEEDQRTTRGVEFTKSGRTYSVRARKGVILSAGAIGSPKILLQSGIGPKKHLEDVGIPLRVDLPVGENLVDHVTTGLDLLMLNESLNLNLGDVLSPRSIYSLIKEAKGPLTMVGVESSAVLEISGYPELQFMVLPVGITHDFGVHLRKISNIDDDVWEKYFKLMLDTPTATILPVVLHPRSRGVVQLRDSNPQSSPIIDPRYLSHPDDKKLLVSGIRILQEISNTAAMRKIGAEINPLIFPGCEHHKWDSNDYWMCYVEHLTLTTYHPVGTCRMGEVVGRDFRVMGMEKLFIVDGSVLPEMPSGNTMASIGMLANRFLAIHRIARHSGQ